jgi:hypothetical protein
MKIKIGICSVLSSGAFACLNIASGQTNSGLLWATFTDTNRHFHFQYPSTWKINIENVSFFHWRDVFVSLNSAECLTVHPDDSLNCSTAEILRQLPAGTAYMDIGYSANPWSSGTGTHDMEAADLSGPLKTAMNESENKGLITRTIEFTKRGKTWSIVTYMHPPISTENRQLLEQVLESFHFDSVPTIDPQKTNSVNQALPH